MRSVSMLWICAALCCCGFNGPVRTFEEKGARLVSVEDAARLYGWDLCVAPDGKTWTLSARDFEIVLRSGSASARVNGAKMSLIAPVVRRSDGVWLVAWADLRHSLKPFLAEGALPPSPVRKIVIDPGHGGRDTGAKRAGMREKDVNLAVAERVAAILRKGNFQVVMTRRGDADLSLDARADRVRTRNADLYVSIHQNAASNEKASGMEIYFSPVNRYADASLRLAHAVLHHALFELGAKPGGRHDRGIKRANFRVIRRADCPAVLLECGFISNPDDRSRMADEAYLDDLAQGIAAGIAAYADMISDTEEDDEP